jgi:RNA polymerase sigma-70 factor (ECF subfamily)
VTKPVSKLFVSQRSRTEEWTDEEVVRRVLGGDAMLFELLMRRHNQRIYRAIRSIVRDDAESEEIMQEAYVRAYEHLAQFEGRAQFTTWLTRIAVNEALRWFHARKKVDSLDEAQYDREDDPMPSFQSNQPNPEVAASRSELRSLLEEAILALPQSYRAVIMLRDVEEMSTAETAEVLSISDANVKVRLHRAHELLREEVFVRAGVTCSHAFEFPATRCDRVVRAVFERLKINNPEGLTSSN